MTEQNPEAERPGRGICQTGAILQQQLETATGREIRPAIADKAGRGICETGFILQRQAEPEAGS